MTNKGNSIGGADFDAYQQTNSFADPIPHPRPQPSNAVNEEGKVGDPLPVVLLAIVALPIIALIASVIWWTAH